ncbi:juvenile hormone esterase-like [Uranotaenia lowii]|uniref:juvenile hormone esterase-like n=1 Tax=Uranotaenia lowii TaxID=190385 RepID=UPI00247ABAA1|nr:juvenile hormone esterase-like [Uranotaenia lowii]
MCNRIVVLFLFLFELIRCNETDKTCVVRFRGSNNIGIGIPSEIFNLVPYCQYLGVRYAEPPLRFKNPVIHNPKGVENYTSLGNICAQEDNFLSPQGAIGQEDCLFLNIYSPWRDKNGSNSAHRKFPVLVFIHGGSFSIGSSTFDIHGADLLVESGVLVVSINYRLSMLGFLRYPRFNVSGNFGLKDQRTALQWVQKHIKYFGGDSKRVTLMGQSAGAASICYHLYSEQSRGLFQQLFPLGGSFLSPWALIYNPQKSADDLIEDLDISSIKELQEVDFEQFFLGNTRGSYKFLSMYNPSFIPTIESISEDEPFITKSPLETIESHLPYQIPILIGHTQTELELVFRLTKFLFVGDNFPNTNDSVTANVMRLVKQRQKSTSDSDFLGKFVNMADMHYPIKRLIRIWSDQLSQSPLYYFKFSFDGKFGSYKNEFYKFRTNGSRYGAVHGDDLGYIFTPYNVEEALANRSQFIREWKVHEQMVELVANFVKYGNPTLTQLKTSNLTWIPYNDNTTQERYLNIGETLELGTDNDSIDELFQFWHDIYQCLYLFDCKAVDNRLEDGGFSIEELTEDWHLP